MKRTRILFLAALFTWPLPALPEPPPPAATPPEKPQQEAEFMRRGEDHFFSRRFGTALEWFRKALALNPDNALAHAYSGDILLSLGRADEAIPHFVVAAELEAEPSAEVFRLGQIYYLKGDFARAESHFLRALSTNDSLGEAHFYLALIAFRARKNRVDTLKQLKAFREKRPGFAGKESVDRAIALLENPDTASSSSGELFETDPLRLFFTRGAEGQPQPPRKEPQTTEATAPARAESPASGADSGSPDLAPTRPIPDTADRATSSPVGPGLLPPGELRPEFLRLEKRRPGPLERAQALRLDDAERALRLLAEARGKTPQEADLAALECEIQFLDRKQAALALPPCRAAAQLQPNFHNLQNLGFVLSAANDGPGAFDAWQGALDHRFDLPLALQTARLGLSLSPSPSPDGKRPQTRRILERSLAANPDHREALLLLLGMQAGDHSLAGLRSTTERLLALFPDDSEVLRQVAAALLADPATEGDAATVLARYVARSPGDIPAGLALASLHNRRSSDHQALAVLQKLYSDHPDHLEVVRAILIFFVHNNRNLDSAQSVARRFLEKNPDPALRDSILELLPEPLRKDVLPPPPAESPSEERKDSGDKPAPP